MDNPLTPKKIQRLINLAEGGSFNIESLLYTAEDVKAMAAQANLDKQTKSPAYRYETSSGIIDLDHVDGFGESGSNINVSLSRSRDLTADEASLIAREAPLPIINQTHTYFTDNTSTSMAAQANLDKQTKSPAYRYETSSGIIDLDHVDGFGESGSNINVSLSRSRDLTADEASLIAREAPLPIINQTHTYFTDNTSTSMAAQANLDKQTKSPAYRYETSSGIIDLDHVDGFGESGSNINVSLSRSRDLTADEASLIAREAPLPIINQTHTYFTDNTSTSMAAQANLDKQTKSPAYRYETSSGIIDLDHVDGFGESGSNINVSLSRSRDLTADEASLIAREAPLPIINQTHTYFTDNTSTSMAAQANLDKQTKSPAYRYETSSGIIDLDHVDGFGESGSNINVSLSRSRDLTADEASLIAREAPLPIINQTHTYFTDNTSTSANNSNLSVGAYFGKRCVDLGKILGKTDSPDKFYMLPSITEETNLSEQSKTSNLIQIDDTLDSVPVRQPRNNDTQTLEQSIASHTSRLEKSHNPVFKKPARPVEKLQATPKVPEKPQHVRSLNPTPTGIPQKSFMSSKPTDVLLKNLQASFMVSGGDVTEESVENSLSLSKIADYIDEPNRSKVPSPNIAYKELDNSVDWQEVLQQKKIRHRGIIVQEEWVEIISNPVEGFVGVTTTVTIKVTTISDSWLTAKFQFNNLPNEGTDLNIELPRLPLLLAPGKTEDFTFHITSDVEMNTILPFTFFVKLSIDGVVEQKGDLQVNFKLPTIQAMSADGINKLLYPAIPENTVLTKIFVLISDCPADLQLKLAITEGDSTFCIKSVQEIKRSDVNKVLLERQGSEDAGKTRTKAMNKQLCRLVKDSAIMVSITFNSPKLDMKLFGKSGIMTSYNGVLQVSLIGSNTVLRSVNLVGLVGIPKLHVDETANNIQVTNEAAKITLINRGAVGGTWAVKYRNSNEAKLPFKITPTKFTIAAEESITIQVYYVGSPDSGLVEVPIYLEELSTGESTEVVLTGGSDKPKSFPIKSNGTSVSWVRAGRKEISLKNNIDKKVHIRCYIVGDGFSIDLPGGESRGIYLLTFNPLECRPLSIVFSPTSCMPHAATLHMAQERSNSDTSRKIKLFGCVSGEPVRWSGLDTYSDTAALVRATSRNNIDLKLHNKSTMPAFIAAKIHYNQQYMQVDKFCHLEGATRILPGRSFHTVSLRVNWPRVERRAREAATTALATVTVLTGAEATRRRILKILKDESKGKLDTSLLPDHLRVLAQEFDGENAAMDDFFVEFSETRSSLSELIHCGLQELTAHIDLPQDFADENTIIIADDTVLDHHTIME